MKYILLILAAMALIGCGEPRPVNVGAGIPIYVVSSQEIRAQAPELKGVGAFTRWKNGVVTEVWLPDDVSPEELVRLTVHEMKKHCGKVELEQMAGERWSPVKCAARRDGMPALATGCDDGGDHE